jgi:hypothetical protein
MFMSSVNVRGVVAEGFGEVPEEVERPEGNNG